MARIVLVQPPNLWLNQPTMYFPLSLMYLGAVLEEAGHEVQFADLREVKHIDVLRQIPEADYVGVTATTPEIDSVKHIAKVVKQRYPKCVTIIGGAHPTHMPENCVNDFDHVVVGEGEEAICFIVEGLMEPQVIYAPPIEDLDSLPFPARHLLPEEKVFSKTLYMGERYGAGEKSTTVISSRGCPYRCAFCANIPQPVRFRGAECFVSEIKYLIDRFDCRYFRFVDDTFTMNRKRLFKICELLEPLNVHYRTHTRSNLVDDEVCEALKRSGCDELALGVETADDDVLKLVNKGITVEQHKQAIRTMKGAGLRVKVYWMTGLPRERWETIERNKAFMREMKPDKWTVAVFTPYPGCEIWSQPERFGVRIINRDFKNYANFPQFFSVIETDVASNKELNEHGKEFYRFCLSEAWK